MDSALIPEGVKRCSLPKFLSPGEGVKSNRAESFEIRSGATFLQFRPRRWGMAAVRY
jgi:hypothetical protein